MKGMNDATKDLIHVLTGDFYKCRFRIFIGMGSATLPFLYITETYFLVQLTEQKPNL